MARIHAKNTDFLVDEFDFGGVTNNVTLDINTPTPDVTAFNDADLTYVAGKPLWIATINGLHSTASPNYDGEMFTDLTSGDRIVGIYPNQFTVGERGYEGLGNISGVPILTRLNQAIALNVTWNGDRPLMRSQSMYRNAAVASSANGTAYQLGTVAAVQTMLGVLRMFTAPGGAGNNDCVVTIESDNAEAFLSPTTQITFSTLNQASVATSQSNSVPGAITDDWWRVVVTISGAGTRTFDLLITLGLRYPN